MAESAAKKKSAKAAPEDFPSRDQALAAFSPALDPSLENVRSLMLALRANPPQLLHLEAGELPQRISLGLWWQALLNCSSPRPDSSPCLNCPDCLQTGAIQHPDLIFFDGRSESIKIQEMRDLRPILGEAPHHGQKRVVFMAEAQALTLEAANSLLKVLEDPNPGTVFIFSLPQRERILPTLISRGFVLTLPWPDPAKPAKGDLVQWEEALADFVRSGRGWWEKSAAKGAMNPVLAQQIVILGQKALAAQLSADSGLRSRAPLAQALKALSPAAALNLDAVCAQCQSALQEQVNPVLVLDYLATQFYLAIR